MANTYLTHTTSTPTNNDKCTISFWTKFSNVGSDVGIFSQHTDSNNRFQLIRTSAGYLSLLQKTSGSTEISIATNRLFRDVSAWYHIVLAIDTTQGTDSDRVKLYVNGVQETSFQTATYPSQNTDIRFNSSSLVQEIGRITADTYMNGSMSHVHFIDGTALAPTVFGSTDSVTGEWSINTSPSVTYGTNGFFILKDGNSVTDQSGNSNNFTVAGGTLTKTEDCPDNVFCTMNPLDNYYANSTFSNGNTSQTSNASAYGWVTSTLGMTTGKFYAECKQTGFSGSSNYNIIGIVSTQLTTSGDWLGKNTGEIGYYSQSGVFNQNSTESSTSSYASYTTNDIIGIALDLDNNKLYFSKNGTWQNSGDPTSGATGTGALNITTPSAMTGDTATGVYRFASGDYGDVLVVNNSWNFGNGYFGTTQISSAGTNASNNGIFEYDVPTGYTALSTKGLNL